MAITELNEIPNGEQLYSTHCSACHGPTGNGGVGVPLDLPDFQYGVTNDYLEKTIRLGLPVRIMPAFTQLSNAEVKSIVKHIRSWATCKPFKYILRPKWFSGFRKQCYGLSYA